ncbi:glutamine--tRNA ligase/YqeY domain fusion protein [Eubacteriales bacterium OttesenSCG-928-N13]|nr:glutamine--tRNA ligase/YqeY domain fusion protein [Eubacteriales bacterium OttesenSCG-928-N13]
MEATEKKTSNFIEEFVEEDLASGRFDHVKTRFPPEPNGYLHIGHVKAFSIDFEIALKHNGLCNLRFDDTNPTKEKSVFVDGIQRDIEWMGYKWDKLFFASDFFDQLYDIAVDLIKKGVAYVDDQSAEQMRQTRGTLTKPGTNSPYRDRSIEENLDLFARMKNGEFEDGSRVLRAKIDMTSPNILMRDPTLYRILRAHHHRTGDKWCIYPMYDFQHPIQDAIEGITHSLCSMEYEIHRPLYDWMVQQAGFAQPPRQIEFARLNLTRTVMSKRLLRRLVEEGHVSGWDDPRMPTLVAMRRRGYTPAAIKDFLSRVGVAKADSVVDGALLEHCVREALGNSSPRAMAVLDPIRLTLTNWPEGEVDTLTMENHPELPELGTREVHFTKHLFIERDDFMENPPGKFFRLKPNGEVRLKGAYIIKCEELIKDENGEITEILCSVDLSSRSGTEGANRKVKGTLHWLSDMDACPAEVRLYEPILKDEAAEESIEIESSDEFAETEAPAKDFIDDLNPTSIRIMQGALVEPIIRDADVGKSFQFLRMGYFCKDVDSTDAMPVYNRTVPLKDSWAKAAKK